MFPRSAFQFTVVGLLAPSSLDWNCTVSPGVTPFAAARTLRFGSRVNGTLTVVATPPTVNCTTAFPLTAPSGTTESTCVSVDVKLIGPESIVPMGPGKDTLKAPNRSCPSKLTGSFALAPFGEIEVIIGG